MPLKMAKNTFKLAHNVLHASKTTVSNVPVMLMHVKFVEKDFHLLKTKELANRIPKITYHWLLLLDLLLPS